MNRLDGVGDGGGRDASYYNVSDVDTSFVDNTPPSDHEDSSELSTWNFSVIIMMVSMLLNV